MKAILIILPFVLFLSCPSWAEIYKWTDESGTIHFTTDPATIPEKYREKTESKLKEEDTLTPQEEIKKTPEECHRTRSKDSDADDAAKAVQGRKDERANYFCSQATRLKLEQAREQYSAHSMKKDESPTVLQYFSQAVVSAEKQLENFEEQARKNGIPRGWLRCQFE